VEEDSRDAIGPKSKRTKASDGKKSQRSEEGFVPMDDDEPEEQLSRNPPRKGKRKSMLRPRGTTASKKSRALQVNQQAEPDPTSSDSDNSVEDANSSSVAYVMSSPGAHMDDRAPKSGQTGDTLAQSEGKVPLPSYYEPRGPGDTWTCPYDGCDHQVWDARAAESIKMISDHFEKVHEGAAEEVVNQESRPWVSVGYCCHRLVITVSSANRVCK
jgi:hypothetical protein